MSWETYVCTSDTANKFWQFVIEGSKVKYRFGRMGLEDTSIADPTVKDYNQREHQKKISEKLGKGYSLVSQEDFDRMQEIARELGAQFKITRMEFVSQRDGSNFTFGNHYMPEEGVVVELTNSWSKDTQYLFLSKGLSGELSGFSWKTNKAKSIGESYASGRMRAIRKVLADLAGKVQQIIKKVGVVGERVLMLDGVDPDDAFATISQEVHSQKSFSFASDQVVAKFATMGERVLAL